MNRLFNSFFSRLVLTTGLSLSSLFCFSQYSFQRVDSIRVEENSALLPSPWAGGLNCPQFSAIDLDGDGKNDLFIYDRSSDRIFTFINKGQPGEIKYVYDKKYEKKFPPLHNWVLLADFNNDGKQDIFASDTSNGQVGISVYRNASDVNGLKFVKMNPPLLLADHSLLYVNQWSLPSISDIDSDGDLDIITFDLIGSQLQFFRNLSVENYGNSDTLLYTLYTKCWGKFSENFGTCDVTLNVACRPGGDKELPLPSPLGHASSTILALDINGDKAKELLIGNILCQSMYLLINGGDSLNANMTNVYTDYPLADSIWIYYHPAAFLLDVDNDGLKDLIVAPNAMNISEDFKGCWLYLNKGTNTVPDFVFQTKSFLQDQMIEVGENAFPVFFDYNADGLQDLLIGNYHYFKSSGYNPSGIALYENAGTSTLPSFKLITRDYANTSSLGLQGICPTFGDLDNDGDYDMIIGDASGHLYYFENTAGTGKTANFILKKVNYENIDVGQYATPQLIDMDRDGMLDLIIGTHNGNINYCHNTGTPELASFQFVTNSMGMVDVRNEGYVTGYSVPFMTQLKDSCHYTLFVGSESGRLFEYTDIENNLTGAFTLADTNFLGIYEGLRSGIGGADINGDGAVDLAIGNFGGGVSLFINTGTRPQSCARSLPSSINIYPGIAVDYLKISVQGINAGEEYEVSLYNMLGQQIFSGTYHSTSGSETTIISLAGYSMGIYFCKVNTQREETSKKIVFLK